MTLAPEEAAALVAEARSWDRTPLKFGQSVKGLGCDCKGFIAGVAREVGRPEAMSVHALAGDYSKIDPIRLRRGLMDLFDRARVIEAGDVLLLKVGGTAQHLAIATGEGSLVHCAATGRRCVFEQPLDGVLGIYPLDSIWRWRSIEA